MDQAQKDIAAAGGDPYKIALAFAKVGAQAPGLERALAPLYQTAMTQAAATGQGSALGEAAGGVGAPGMSRQYQGQGNQPDPNMIAPIAAETQQAQPPTAEGKKSSTDIDSIANQYLAEVRPDLVNPATQYGAIATFDSEIKQDLTPQEEAQLRQQLFDKYKNPNIVNPTIDRIREGIKNRYNEALSKYGFDKEKRQQIQQKWQDFTSGSNQRLQPHIGKYGEEFPRTKEVLTNKYNQYAAGLPVNMTPEQMHTNSMALLQNDINKLDALHAAPSMPPVHNTAGVKEYIDSNKGVYKDLADMGFIEALREDAILNKDMGNEEFHSLIWGDQTSKENLNKIHAIKAPIEYKPIQGAPGHTKYNSAYPKEHEKYISNLSKELRGLKPQDDLVLARAMVLDSGGNIKDFNDALANAQQNGLKLSEFQKGQLQETNIPRRPPLWEIFSGFSPLKGGPAAGVLEGFNWKPFINYVRGKK